eukprot:13710533-Alexandrium_andersonii.AAC.1
MINPAAVHITRVATVNSATRNIQGRSMVQSARGIGEGSLTTEAGERTRGRSPRGRLRREL